MGGYKNYDEFLNDIKEWGQAVQSCNSDAMETFCRMWEKSREGADNNVFSPFLYVSLSAGMTVCETLFLAAVLYCSLYGKEDRRLTRDRWNLFWRKEYGPYTESELFYETAPLLFYREAETDGREITVSLIPRVWLFLSSGFLEEKSIPGLKWYWRRGDRLSFLGESACRYREMKNALENVRGKRLFCLSGDRGTGRKLNYTYMASELGMDLGIVRWSEIRSEALLRDIRTECLLRHALLVFELDAEDALTELLEWMREEENIFLCAEKEIVYEPLRRERTCLFYHIDAKVVQRDGELFRKMTEEYTWEKEDDRREFLERYDFPPGKIRYILELAETYRISDGRDSISREDVRRAVLRSGRHSLNRYAKKINGIYTMDDLILPGPQRQKLFYVCQRVKNRKHVYERWGFYEKSAYGNGVSVVFSGPPGTGKTMAAQAIASELGMELYRVELPAVVDKYIGETEKKLNKIFDEARKSMAVLFFDEADVLFSKRTEIRESNDKYSNMEIAFLLQKMEEHDGVSILATNYLQNFDEAFRRRVSDIVDFPVPDAGLREKMWRSMVPDRLPVSEDIDFEFLARQFQITGSVIKSSLICGSFLAAEKKKEVLEMEDVLRGLAHELEKSGRKLTRSDYGEYGYLIGNKREAGGDL